MEDLTARIAQKLPQVGELESVRPLLGGACQDNFVIKTRGNGKSAKYALRSDAATSLPGSINREQEYQVISAAVQAGVPTPGARWLTRDLIRDGSWAYLLDWVDGIAIGGKVVRAPELESARARLPKQLARALAAIHTIVPSDALSFLEVPADPVEEALLQQREALDSLPRPRPALELAYRWLHQNRPSERPVKLLHGDFRVGNFMVDQSGLKAVLDWEFAHFGDPLEDIAWLCVRDWRFGVLDRPAGGLSSRKEFCSLYSEFSGTQVDPSVLHFWEVMGNLRWGAGALAQGMRYLRGGEPRLELLAIARRVAEMEYEALRLIETGPEDWS